MASGLSFWAIGQILLAGALVFLWGRSIVKTFNRPAKAIAPLEELIEQERLNYSQTPTISPFTIILQYPTERPTATPTPRPTPTPRGPKQISTPKPKNLDQLYEYNIGEDLYGRSYVIGSQYYGKSADYVVPSKYSYYWPPLGGINCDVIKDKEECLYLASGAYGPDNVGIAWACPADFPFYSTIYIRELDIWGRCLDRGGAIRKDPRDGLYWFDQLLDFGLLYWSEEMTVEVYLP